MEDEETPPFDSSLYEINNDVMRWIKAHPLMMVVRARGLVFPASNQKEDEHGKSSILLVPLKMMIITLNQLPD